MHLPTSTASQRPVKHLGTSTRLHGPFNSLHQLHGHVPAPRGPLIDELEVVLTGPEARPLDLIAILPVVIFSISCRVVGRGCRLQSTRSRRLRASEDVQHTAPQGHAAGLHHLETAGVSINSLDFETSRPRCHVDSIRLLFSRLHEALDSLLEDRIWQADQGQLGASHHAHVALRRALRHL